MAKSIEKTTNERGKTYGDASVQWEVAQAIKSVMRGQEPDQYKLELTAIAWHNLPPIAREALDMIATKMSRIIVGGISQPDTWHDIGGYAKVIEGKINGN